jgi:hypothetical protein
MGMATMVKASLLRVLGPEAWLVAWAQASWLIQGAMPKRLGLKAMK